MNYISDKIKTPKARLEELKRQRMMGGQTYQRPSPEVESSEESTVQVAEAKPEREYTGDLIKGIGVMHKSNLVPVIDEEQAKEIAKMRR